MPVLDLRAWTFTALSHIRSFSDTDFTLGVLDIPGLPSVDCLEQMLNLELECFPSQLRIETVECCIQRWNCDVSILFSFHRLCFKLSTGFVSRLISILCNASYIEGFPTHRT